VQQLGDLRVATSLIHFWRYFSLKQHPTVPCCEHAPTQVLADRITKIPCTIYFSINYLEYRKRRKNMEVPRYYKKENNVRKTVTRTTSQKTRKQTKIMVKLLNQSDNKLLTFDSVLSNSRANTYLKPCFHLPSDGTASSNTLFR
jgi:hypothetical protein